MIFLGDGGLPIDKTRTENELRRVDDWFRKEIGCFVGSLRCGSTAASMYSLVSSAAPPSLRRLGLRGRLSAATCGGSSDYESFATDVCALRNIEVGFGCYVMPRRLLGKFDTQTASGAVVVRPQDRH